mmetsp:Transcript_13963/g.41591  ORF Transcript_13963/g.41591 Transcript_13963/m.41591 type:complete len:305 (-) Transcript_13963:172-1086(-)
MEMLSNLRKRVVSVLFPGRAQAALASKRARRTTTTLLHQKWLWERVLAFVDGGARGLDVLGQLKTAARLEVCSKALYVSVGLHVPTWRALAARLPTGEMAGAFDALRGATTRHIEDHLEDLLAEGYEEAEALVVLEALARRERPLWREFVSLMLNEVCRSCWSHRIRDEALRPHPVYETNLCPRCLGGGHRPRGPFVPRPKFCKPHLEVLDRPTLNAFLPRHSGGSLHVTNVIAGGVGLSDAAVAALPGSEREVAWRQVELARARCFPSKRAFEDYVRTFVETADPLPAAARVACFSTRERADP